MTYIRIPVPRVSPVLGSNLLGVAGLTAIIVAVGALTGWPWALLTGGVFAVALTVLAQHAAQPPVAAGAPVAAAAPVRPSRIEAEAARIIEESAQRLADSTRAEPA